MNRFMRAKVIVTGVQGTDQCRQVTYRAVCKADAYPKGGKDENNTFALFTPSMDMNMWINNPEIPEIKVNDQFYVDFIKVES